ncbi:protein of unknown function [Streptococcus thermophilus]|uniref:Uncharacterized protein n=1 Tax=Streptococcus thermophilus TaxID=1308 RepID=A0A8D6U0R8_STRTR|nr:protein of unknown function [Streptococcus thermophilus]
MGFFNLFSTFNEKSSLITKNYKKGSKTFKKAIDKFKKG